MSGMGCAGFFTLLTHSAGKGEMVLPPLQKWSTGPGKFTFLKTPTSTALCPSETRGEQKGGRQEGRRDDGGGKYLRNVTEALDR